MVLEKIGAMAVGFAVMALFQLLIYNMLMEAKCVAENYRKENIPVGLGIAYTVSAVVSIMVLNLYFEKDLAYSMTTVVLSMGFVGLMDDLIGDKDTKGFKGHIKSLFKGKLTTGGLKAVSGFGISFLISLAFSSSLLDLVVNTLLIALFTNIINLFDLRPGRACKAFILFSALALLTASTREYDFLILSAVGAVLAYIKYDLSAKSMLGDVGSNAMGITIGLFCAATNPLAVKVFYTALLLGLHVLSEFYSFSKIIENNRVLRAIDQFGRR